MDMTSKSISFRLTDDLIELLARGRYDLRGRFTPDELTNIVSLGNGTAFAAAIHKAEVTP